MKLPLRYSFRNLARRKWRTMLTILAIALVVAVSVFMLAFSRGILHTAKDSGSPDNIIIVDRRATSQTFSLITLRDFALLKSLPQIKTSASGEVLISPEAIQQVFVNVGAHEDRPGLIRGVKSIFFEVNTKVRIVEGEQPSEGRNVVVGKLTAAALGVPEEALAIGQEIEFEREKWKIVGHFSAGGTSLDSEILGDLSDIMATFARTGYSNALIKLNSVDDVELLVNSLNSRNDIQVKAVQETEYYRSLKEGFDRFIFISLFMAVIAAMGGLVSGMNTMYASVLGRVREIGTLKVLGFRSSDVVLSFVLESLFISLIGAVIGCAAGYLANGFTTKFADGAMALIVDEYVLGAGMAVGLLIGILGAIPPALKGVRMNITTALRYNG